MFRQPSHRLIFFISLGLVSFITGLYLFLPVSDKPSLSLTTIDKFVIYETPQTIPPIAYQTANGQAKSVADWQGRYLLVNFWASWCAPCRKEMPSLDQLQQDFADKPFTVLALSLDTGAPEKGERFLNDLGISHLARGYLGHTRLMARLKLVGLPTTILLNPQGKEIARLSGDAQWHSEDIKARLIALAP